MHKLVPGLLVILSVVSVRFAAAQTENPCGTDLVNNRYGLQHPEKTAEREQTLELIRQFASGHTETGAERSTVVIPTVVHIMHKGGAEDLTQAQVEDAIRVLNSDIRRQNADTANTRALFKPYGADFNIEFRLAKLDPSGNCTNGITRTFAPNTYEANDDIKFTSTGGINAWPVNRYFNIWVVGKIKLDQSGVIGYAQFPSWGMSSGYGVVIDNQYFGTVGTAQGKDGRTLTHEVGHCLELYHTFQSGCGDNCSSSGDQVCDTPPVSAATYNCSFTLNTCSNDDSGPSAYNTDVPDMVENYMSYNQNFCQNIFTKGQKLRSDAVLQNTFLGQLITPANQQATGTADGFSAAPCALVPDFRWSRSVICTGDSVKFSDLTANGVPDAWQWDITGSGPVTATGASPTVVFQQPGIYGVTMRAVNASGTYTAAKQAIIRVTGGPGTTDFFDGFDNQPLTGGRWMARNLPYGYGWEEYTVPGNGNRTVYIRNVDNRADFLPYELYSPVYDISGIPNPRVLFKTAYAQKNAYSRDRLRVYFSTDCGNTWLVRFSRMGELLASMPAGTLPAEPAQASNWAQWEASVPSFMAGANSLMVKFLFETGGGNNFYLDDINILEAASVAEYSPVNILAVSPNPTADYVTLDLTPFSEPSLQLSVYDMGGRMILNRTVAGGAPLTLSVHTEGLSAGMYRVSVKGKSAVLSGKIIVTE